MEGSYTRKEAHRIMELFRSPQHLEEMGKEMDRIWESAEVEEMTSLQQERYKEEARILLNRVRKQERKFPWASLLKYAAVLLLVFSAGWAIYRFSDTGGLRRDTVCMEEVRVKNGERKEVVLPDGTKVMLNAGSYLKYPERFAPDSRRIEMDGEAFFDVVHEEGRPFVVSTKDADIKVLGTSFDVKAYDTDEQIQVSVCTGKVQVDMADVMMRLLPDEQLVFSRKSGEVQKRNENARHATVWIDGGLYFNRTSINNVVKELERMYDCTIELSENVPRDSYIYGEHDNKSLEAVLKSIEYSTDIRHKKEGDKIVLYK